MAAAAGSGMPLSAGGFAQANEREQPFWPWFGGFLQEELAPYPGRLDLAVRMVVAATLTMLLIMTFRLPGAAVAGYYTLLLSRDSPKTTVRAALTVLGAYLACAAYCMVGVVMFLDEPLTHFLFVVVSLFLSFFMIRVVTNYSAGAAFSFTLAVVLPLWDAPRPTDQLVTSTLWAASSVSVGLAATIAVEYAFNLFDPRDPLREGIADRLAVVSEVLSQCCRDQLSVATRRRIERYGSVGVSRLRKLAGQALSGDENFVQRSTVVSLVGRLVDLSNAVLHLPPPGEEDARRLRRVGRRIEAIGKVFSRGRHLGNYAPAEHGGDAEFSLLHELERTVQLLAVALTTTPPTSFEATEEPQKKQGFLVADAFSNREYLHFALRGCLATTLCYVLMNAVAWPGLSTSLATCIVTALSTVGSSRQKQILRLAGTALGGVVLGMGAQALILPMLDGIGGFTILFAAVTLLAAWISTASARISYLGLQMALAFDLVHLQEYYPLTDLAIGRDRVMGVALGLMAMWLVFDRLGGRRAADVMRETFEKNLHLLAKLAEPWPQGRTALDRHSISRLREQIFNNFAEVNAQADAVLLEVGPARREHLAWRARIRAWQPSLRTLYVILVALLQYRLQVTPEEIAPEIVKAQRELDAAMKARLEELARSFAQGVQPPEAVDLRQHYQALEDAVWSNYILPPARARAVLSLSSHLVEIAAA